MDHHPSADKSVPGEQRQAGTGQDAAQSHQQDTRGSMAHGGTTIMKRQIIEN